MEKPSVHQRKSSKQAKPKKKPIKVVYISNPMKVKTSASEFRALVQELTGRDSNLADAAKFMENNNGVDGAQLVPDQGVKIANDHVPDVPRVDPDRRESPRSFGSSIESYDDMFNSQMLENFAGFLPSSLLYDSPQ
ncbi:hypothetical protein HHK36_017164 [Tetracentron sinense]|uniref:VQ domain-containing protein n=1 Tax=Tetracentron sinense TaxID=13715 RepID=A0A835DBM9_TETSI|nr:hypothetical protein HHK36_017164 [Tetracentron sinense]